MLAAVLFGGIEPLAAIAPLDGVHNQAPRLLPQLVPGQTVSARVGAALPDGSFRVEVAGQEMRMLLPGYVSAGDSLELTFLTRDPRPTFMLQQPPQAEPAALLSSAGRMVASMLPPRGRPAVLAAAPAAAPLLAALPADATPLSAALARTLEQSGLFYEAHQAEWVAGRRDLAQLRAEPQARLAQGTAQLLPAQTAATSSAATVDAAAAAITPQAQQPAQAQAPPLVQQQLAALESARIVLQLEVWPGQWMQWGVEERAPQAQHATDAAATWRTRLRLDLPQLGELDAALTLGSNGVQIKLDAASGASATLLQQHCPSLRSALAAAGMAATVIAVAQHEPI